MMQTIKGWLEAIRCYDDIVIEFGVMAHNHSLLQEKYSKVAKKYLDGTTVDELEKYWNEKRVKVNKQWKARDGVNMDVRCFFQRDCTLPKFTGSADEIAKKVLSWGIRNIHYELDDGEFWQYGYETYLSRVGDCEDGAILMANIMYNSGVPYWRIRLNIGKVKGGYHAWLTYLKEEDNEWYVMDWCYWPRESDGLKLKWKDAENYFTTDASWNCRHSFGGLSK